MQNSPKIREAQIRTISILGSGWLGMSLASHFLDRGDWVKVSSRSEKCFPEQIANSAQQFIVDIDQQDNDITEFLQADILIINITSKDIANYTQLIAKIEQSTIKNVLFVSSTSVYANLNTIVNEEEGAELGQSALYQIEQLFSNNTHFLTTVVRFSGLIGYKRHPGRFFAPGKAVQQPYAPVNLIHRDDCIGIINAIIEQDVWAEVFNGCADTHPTKRQFYSHARNLLDLPAPDFADEIKNAYKIVSNTKVKQHLNYQFKYPDVMDIRFE